jgi:hypothetical protein
MPAKGTHMPDWQKQLVSKAQKGKVVSKETRKKISDFAKTRTGSKNPHWGKHQSKEAKEKIGTIHRGKKQTPESNLKRSLALLGRTKNITPKGMVKKIARNTGKNNNQYGKTPSYETRLKKVEASLGGFWYGNVRYNQSTHDYCFKWRHVKPRVKAFFDNTCVLCGKPISGFNLIGHHVFYEKNACCILDEEGGFWTNLNVNDHPAKDYYIGKNPNYFVTLCRGCHNVTNGTYDNRKRYAEYFRNLIDTKYNGKCFLPKKED